MAFGMLWFVLTFLVRSYSDWVETDSQSSLISVSLMAKDVEHFFLYLIGHFYFLEKKLSIQFISCLLIRFFALLLFNFLSFSHILDINLLPDA